MKKLSDFKNEEALDVLADILEPATEILQDKEIAKLGRAGKKVEAVKVAIKFHKKSVLAILARLNETPVEEYECSVVSLPLQLLQLLNDKELADFFSLQGEMTQA